MTIHGIPGLLEDHSTWTEQWLPKFRMWAEGKSVPEFSNSDALAPIILAIVLSWIFLPLLWRTICFVTKLFKRLILGLKFKVLKMTSWLTYEQAFEIAFHSDYGELKNPHNHTQPEKRNRNTFSILTQKSSEFRHVSTKADDIEQKRYVKKFIRDFKLLDNSTETKNGEVFYNEGLFREHLEDAADKELGIE